MRQLLTLTIALCLLFLHCGCAAEEKLLERSKSEDIAVTVKAATLVEDYKANEVKADEKYKDKVIAVTGKVEAIKKGLGGQPIVLLSAPKRFVKVRCMFGKEYAPQVAKISKGNVITVKGVCKGKLGSVNLGGCIPQ